MDLAQIFLWCAICGYAAGIVMFVWPAYRLTAICLLILNIWSWRFTFNISSFKAVFSAGRYHRMARSDTLTGLLNRMAIRDEISQRLNDGSPFTVLFLDFDRFKLINDTLGHDAGDDLLKAIAERLQSAMDDRSVVERPGLASRTGGDEFLVVFDGVDQPEPAVIAAERLLERFREPFNLAGRSIRSVPSIGVTVSDDSGRSADDMIRDADIAMYRAKTSGRACAALFDNEMRSQLERRLMLENDLAHAITAGQILAFYQPIVDLDSGELTGFEALARWRHPVHGLIPPSDFIGIAEEIGMIEEIGLWMLTEAASQLAQWRRSIDPKGALHIHVNVSANQLRHDEMIEQFVDAVTSASVTTGQIVLEVTESVFVGHSDSACEVLAGLRNAGFGIAMDDFGTGYSSLASLHRFEIDVLKIDRAFVRDATGRPDHAAVLHAMVTLADNLGVVVVAEGVETPEQLAELQALGCALSQGYYFSKPIPPEEIPHWVSRWRNRPMAA